MKNSINVYGKTPHCFRHPFATHAHLAGVDNKTLQSTGGWKDLSTMKNIYIHTQQEDLETRIDACVAPQCGEDYGYLFWRGAFNSFRADGKYGQLSMIQPERNAVVSVVSECQNGEGLTNLLNHYIRNHL